MTNKLRNSALLAQRILVLEEDYFQADILAQDLEAAGAQVMGPVPSVDAALRLLAEQDRPDLALLDVALTGTSLLPVIKVLAAQDVPLVLTSSWRREQLPGEYAHVPLYPKPISLHELTKMFEAERSIA